MFAKPDGAPYNPAVLNDAVRTVCRRAGMRRIRLHDLKHTHATLILKQIVHPKIVSERLGHSSVNITLDIYTRVIPGMQKDAALRFAEALDSA